MVHKAPSSNRTSLQFIFSSQVCSCVCSRYCPKKVFPAFFSAQVDSPDTRNKATGEEMFSQAGPQALIEPLPQPHISYYIEEAVWIHGQISQKGVHFYWIRVARSHLTVLSLVEGIGENACQLIVVCLNSSGRQTKNIFELVMVSGQSVIPFEVE